MTPEEKAKELVDKFDIGEQLSYYSIKHALITVNEIIKYSPNKPIEEYNPIEYFKKVKQEIEKL